MSERPKCDKHGLMLPCFPCEHELCMEREKQLRRMFGLPPLIRLVEPLPDPPEPPDAA